MKSSIAVTLVLCGTILLLFPFGYFLVYSSQQSYMLSHRTDMRLVEGVLNYNPPPPHKAPLQSAVGITGLLMILAGAVGGTWPFRNRKVRQAQIPIDVNLTAYAPEGDELED